MNKKTKDEYERLQRIEQLDFLNLDAVRLNAVKHKLFNLLAFINQYPARYVFFVRNQNKKGD